VNVRVRQGILVLILIAASIWGYQNIFGEKRTSTAARPATAAATAIRPPAVQRPAAKAATARSTVIPNVDELRQMSWGADPFRRQLPTASPKTTGNRANNKPEWRLTGIFFSDSGPIAVINDKLVRVGETIDQAEIVDINKKQVTLRTGGKERILTLPNG